MSLKSWIKKGVKAVSTVAAPFAPWAPVVGDVVSGLFGKDQLNTANQNSERMYRNRLQWTVEDAKKAGIHPIYAIGSGAGNSSASTFHGNPMGDAVRNATHSIGSRIQQAKQNELNERLVEAQIGELAARSKESEAIANYNNSQAALANNQWLSQFRDSLVGFEPGSGVRLQQGVPDVVTHPNPKDPSRTAGTHAGFRETVIDKFGTKVAVPDDIMSQALESAGGTWYLARQLIQQAIRRSGGIAKRAWWNWRNNPEVIKHRSRQK